MHCAQEEQATKCGIDTDAVTEQRDSIGAIISFADAQMGCFMLFLLLLAPDRTSIFPTAELHLILLQESCPQLYIIYAQRNETKG
jgi:hypothetical protein